MTSWGLLLCTLFTITSAGQQFFGSPTILEIGLVKKLQIECTATADSTLPLTTQIRILFSRNTVPPVYELLGIADPVFGVNNFSGAVDSGEIVGNGTSKLKLTWNYPTHDRAGVYKCEVGGKSTQGLPEVKSLTFYVSAVLPDQVTALEFFQSTTKDLDEMKVSLAEEKRKHAKLSGQLENGKSKFFRVSNVFQGRRYYLSADSNILVTGDSEAMCEIFGGYLVEIDSAEEYQFIVAFLRNFTQHQLVLTGGSDEVLENNWINTYSQATVKYFNWNQGEPNGGVGSNCIYFSSFAGWKMDDYKCMKGQGQFIFGYLCEIPE